MYACKRTAVSLNEAQTARGLRHPQAKSLLKPGAQLVLTFKNVFPKKAAWIASRDEQLQRLGGEADGVTMLQLFANTPRECTVLATIKAA